VSRYAHSYIVESHAGYFEVLASIVAFDSCHYVPLISI